MNNQIYKTLVIAPAALIVFYLSMVGGFNLFNTVLAWTNPSATPPTESLTPIPVSDGGTGASSAASARADLGAAASGANSDITSLSPSGNLIISPTGGVGIGTTSLGTGALVTVNGNLVANGELQSTLQTGDGQIRMIAGNYGSMWRNDGTNTWFLLTASGNQYGGWNSLRPMQISDSAGEVYMANGLDVTSGGITFPDGTTQTTAYVNPSSGSQTWTTPGTYTWTVPSGVTRILVAVYGGGGGGGYGFGAGINAGGGGGGGGAAVGFISVSPGESLSIQVGAGGNGGFSGSYNGGSGGESYLIGGSPDLYATGGSGGVGNVQGSGNVSGGCGSYGNVSNNCGGSGWGSSQSAVLGNFDCQSGGGGGAGAATSPLMVIESSGTYGICDASGGYGLGNFPAGGSNGYGGTQPGGGGNGGTGSSGNGYQGNGYGGGYGEVVIEW